MVYMPPSREEHIARVDEIVSALESSGKLELLWNGVGSEYPLLSWAKPRAWIRKLFAGESKFHDVGYCVGGKALHRDYVDREFTLRCFNKIQDLGFFDRLRATFWLRLDDDVLRNFGSLSFNYRQNGEPCYDINKLLNEV